MSFYPFNPNMGQVMQSNVKGENPDLAFISHLTWEGPLAAGEDSTGLGQVVTSAAAVTAVDVSAIVQPDVARNVVINPTGTVADIAAGNITVTGMDIAGNVISEDIAVVADQAHDTLSPGSKAFASITAISIPIQDGAAAKFFFGYGDKLGLPYKRDVIPVIAAYLDKVKEGTAPAIAVSALNLESNTINLDSALNGDQVDVYLIV